MSKRRREEDGYGEMSVDPALLAALEASAPAEVLDVRGVKKMVLSLERKLRDNLEARMKYVDQPEKFADSEVELDEELKKMHALAASPDLYPELVRLNVVPSLLGLLTHENTDIASNVVDLLKELTDSDAIADSDEPAGVLVNALVENNALELLVQNLSRIDEADTDEAAAVFNTLTIVENMIEVSPEVANQVCERSKLLKWLLTRIRVKEFDSNKLYSTEILAILLQAGASNQRLVVQLDGMDTLLKCIAMYKSKNPKTEEEEEMLENLFDCLCSTLMLSDNKETFVKAEGLELMIIIMRERKLAYGSAVKALDFALTDCPAGCEQFVDVQGLKCIFAAFMGKIPKHQKTDRSVEEIDERVISVVCSLFGGLRPGSRRDRLLNKFLESECEKLDRLMELFLRYSKRVKAEAQRIDDNVDIEDEQEAYLRKLDAGLFTLQLLAVILGHLWGSSIVTIRDRMTLLLKQQRLSTADVKQILQEFHDNIGDADAVDEERDKRRSRVQAFIRCF